MMTRISPNDITVRASSGLVVESSQSSVGADGSSREREDEDPEVINCIKYFMKTKNYV